MNFYDDCFLDDLQKLLPPLFTRETASKMTGGIFTPKTLSNFDAAGNGPRRKIRVGKKIVYAKDDFIEWLRNMMDCPNRYKNSFKKSWPW